MRGASVLHGFTHFRLRLVEAEVAGGACCERNVDAPYFWQEADAEGRFSALALSTLMRKVLAAYAEVQAEVESRS